MSETINLANVLLILGCIYFIYQHGFSWWLIALIIVGLASWCYHSRRFDDSIQEKYKAEIALLKAKTKYYSLYVVRLDKQ